METIWIHRRIMNDNNENNAKEITEFTEKTRKEVKWWDWAGRVLPLVALVVITITHYGDFHSVRDIIIDVGAIVFISVCFIWWYWALRKIVVSIKYIHRAHERFLEIAEELKKLRKSIKKDDSDR